jgi:hypothetical protein
VSDPWLPWAVLLTGASAAVACALVLLAFWLKEGRRR